VTEIGATLREARMRRSLEIIDVERATKIRAKYLRAMEDEEWALLPGPTFVKSFLRTYGDHLGLDSRLLVEEWRRRHERVAETELPPLAARGSRGSRSGAAVGGGRAARAPREPGRWRGVLLAVVIVVGLLAGLYALGTRSSKDDAPVPAPRGKTTPGAGGSAGTTTTPKAKPAPSTVRLQLRATAPLYVCLVDGGGRKLINGRTVAPGRPTPVFRSKRFRMNLGNSSVVLRVNGRRVAVPPASRGVGLEITPKGRRALPSGRRPNCA
jgi:hypothetical protein